MILYMGSPIYYRAIENHLLLPEYDVEMKTDRLKTALTRARTAVHTAVHETCIPFENTDRFGGS